MNLEKKEAELKKAKNDIWNADASNISGRLTGLLAAKSTSLPLPKSTHEWIKTTAEYETGRGLFLSTSLSLCLILFVFIYEMLI